MPYKKTGCSRPCRNVGQKSNVMICPKLLLTIAFPQITCYDFVLCLQTIGCWQHSLQVSQSWATSSHCVSCWNTFDRCSPPINCFCSSQNGNSVFKRLPTLKKWKPAKPTPSRPLRTPGNGLILPSHMQSQPTREAMWQSEDPERLQTYMKVSAVPTYRTQLGENEETHVTFLLPQYNRTWAA